MKAQIVLTPSESKRLIGMAVAAHPDVKDAHAKGILAIALGTTNAYVAEEVLGETIPKENFAAGIVDEKGNCVVGGKDRDKEIVLEKGQRLEEGTVEAAKRMGPGDVFVKGGNALDMDGVVGVWLASEVGGTIAKVLGILKARGTKIIIPIGLEKLIPYSVSDLSNAMGIFNCDYATGIPVGIMPVAGEIITEIEAFDILTGTMAELAGGGGLGDGTGAKLFFVEGNEKAIGKVKTIVEKIKGESPVGSLRGDCSDCIYTHCPSNAKYGGG